ncbi:MAG: hypothetical protein PHW02_08735, partial [bacterium]|nr:hypothetical protein [bacterium]
MSEMQFNVLAKELGAKTTDLIKAVNKKFKEAQVNEKAYTSKMKPEWVDYCRMRFSKNDRKEKEKEQKSQEPEAEETQKHLKPQRKFVKIEKHIKEPPKPTEEELRKIEEERLAAIKAAEEEKLLR